MDDLDRYLPPYTADLARARRQTVGTLLSRTAAKVGSRTAVVHRDTRRTFAELDTDANRVANALVERGVARNDRVAILSRNSYAFVVAYFALARVGAISVPVNFNFTAGEVRYVLEDSAATAAVVEDALADTFEDAGVDVGLRVVVGTRSGWTGFDELLAHDDATEPDVEIGDDDPVQLLYTSGTTSAPKGAIMTNRNLIAQYVSDIVDGEYHRDDVELHALPLYHCAALHDFLTPDVYLGATSVILPGPDPAAVLGAIAEHKVTKYFAPPTVWIGLLRSPDFDSTDLSSLRKGYYGASIMPVPVLRRLQERLPDLGFYNCFGQSEIGPLAMVLRPEEHAERPASCGRPVLFVEARCVDESGADVAAGERGEVVYRSPQLCTGYWADEAATAESFREGWFRSGDMAVRDAEGFYTVVDRLKDVINTGGVLVASREVEDALYGHPAVAEVAVVGLPDDRWIEAITAVVVLSDTADDTATTADELLAFGRERLPGFKAPKHVHVVEELPKNASGKLLKRVLRDELGG